MIAVTDQNIEIKIRSYLEGSGFKQLEKQVMKARSETLLLNSATAKISQNVGVPFKVIEKNVKQATTEMKRFRMEYLSVLFFGQALQRLFGGLLRASFATWSAVTEGTNQAGGAMGQLSAAWEFFKYSLFDALANSGAFQSFVDFVLRLVEWWGNLSEKTKSFVSWLVVAGLVIGVVLTVVGTMKLLLDSVGLILVGHHLKWTGIGKAIGLVYTFIIAKLIPAIWSIGVAIAASPITWMVLFALAILTTGGYLVWLGNKLGGFGELAKAVGVGIIRVFGAIGEAISDLFVGTLVWASNKLLKFLDMVYAAAKAFDSVFGTNIAGRVAKQIQSVESLRNSLSEFKDSDFFLNSAQKLIDAWGLAPKMTGQEEQLGFDDYLKDLTDKFSSVFSSKESGGGVMKVEVTNGEEIGRGVANNMPATNVSVNGSNVFYDEMNRQGLGQYLPS